MADPVVVYPFDPTGQASTNRVTAEEIIVLPPGDRLFHYTMPKLAPFFQAGLTVKLRDMNNNIIPLTLGVDYYLGHKFMDASLATMHPIYGSISFLRRDIAGTILIDYQHLGGIWTVSTSVMAEILLNKIRNPRTTAWEQVVERPVDFPVIDHVWNLDDMVGQKEILEVMERFYEAYIISLDPDGGGGGGAILAHLANMQNPHQTTAVQVGAYDMVQVDTKLGLYLPKTSQAVDSDKLGGKTLTDIQAELKTTKIDSAEHADEATNADRATTASDSDRLNGQSLLQIMQTVATSTVSNATRVGNRTVSQLTTDILSGTAANSNKLEGRTLAEIINLLQQSTGDATTLQGKSLEAIMNDVLITKINLATRADIASNAEQLGGKSLNQILSDVGSVTPENAKNADRVYGYLFNDLVTSILESPTYIDGVPSRAHRLDITAAPIISKNNGGSQEAGYHYLRIGEFPIPTTFALNGSVVFDPSIIQHAVGMDIMFFYDNRVHTFNVDLAISHATRLGSLKYFCNTDPGTEVFLGIDNSLSTLMSEDGTKTARFVTLYAKFRQVDAPTLVGIWLPITNDFVLDDPDLPLVYDPTCSEVNNAAWQLDDAPYLSQQAFDNFADGITALIQNPAA